MTQGESGYSALVNETLQALESLQGINPEKLFSGISPQLRGLDSSKAVAALRQVESVSLEVTAEFLHACAPAGAMNNIKAHVGQISTGIATATRTNVSPQVVEAALANIVASAEATVSAMLPIIGAGAALGVGPALTEELGSLHAKVLGLIADSDKRLTEAQTRATELAASMERQATEANDTLATIREHSVVAAVSVHAAEFKQLAEEHEGAGIKWFWGTMLTTVAVAASVAFLLVHERIPDEAKTGTIAQYAITRAAFLVLASYALVWCSRNYRAHRHLAVVNRHRKTALATFETFIKSTSHEDTKNAVLLETTRSIFSSGATGYIVGESESGGADRIVEIIKAAGGSGK